MKNTNQENEKKQGTYGHGAEKGKDEKHSKEHQGEKPSHGQQNKPQQHEQRHK